MTGNTHPTPPDEPEGAAEQARRELQRIADSSKAFRKAMEPVSALSDFGRPFREFSELTDKLQPFKGIESLTRSIAPVRKSPMQEIGTANGARITASIEARNRRLAEEKAARVTREEQQLDTLTVIADGLKALQDASVGEARRSRRLVVMTAALIAVSVVAIMAAVLIALL